MLPGVLGVCCFALCLPCIGYARAASEVMSVLLESNNSPSFDFFSGPRSSLAARISFSRPHSKWTTLTGALCELLLGCGDGHGGGAARITSGRTPTASQGGCAHCLIVAPTGGHPHSLALLRTGESRCTHLGRRATRAAPATKRRRTGASLMSRWRARASWGSLCPSICTWTARMWRWTHAGQ